MTDLARRTRLRRSAAIPLGALLCAALGVSLPASAAGAVRVTAAGPAPVVAPAGAPLAVLAQATGGSGRLGLVLAPSQRRAKGGVVLGGRGARVAGSGRRAARVKVRGTVPRDVRRGQIRYLLVCADAKAAVAGRPASCRPAGRVPTSGPNLDQRLAAAVAARRLTRGKALLYGFYAINRDPRLPLELRAASAGSGGAGELVRAAARAGASLPRAIRRELTWYFVPPAGRGSRWRGHAARRAARAAAAAPDCAGYSSLSGSPYDGEDKAQWIGVATADRKALVWYQEGEADAQASARFYARILPGIWKKLSAEFGEPQSDAKEGCFHGPDGRFDVYVNNAVTYFTGGGGRNLAATLPYPAVGDYPVPGKWCTDRPAWITIRPGQPRWTLAHEFMHAIQFAHRYASCDPPISWWDEGGATWAADFVYPTDDYEKARFPEWISSPLARGGFANYDYEAYPFWMMLQRTQGTRVLRSIFDQLRTKRSVPAVDAAVPGGLARQWPRFALQIYNQEPIGRPGFPIAESFAAWDRWEATPDLRPADEVALDGAKEKTIGLPTQNAYAAAPLSVAAYHRVIVTDSAVRELRFTNALKGAKAAHVDAMVRLADGSWTLQNWTGRDVTLCRDRADENVQEVDIVTTNAGPTQAIPAFTHALRVRDRCETPAFRIVGYSESLRTDTARGFGLLADTWKGAPGEPVSLPPGPYFGEEPTYALTTRVTTTHDGRVTGPGPECPHTYPTRTLDNPGALDMAFDPAGTGPATVAEAPGFLAVGDIEVDTCGAYTTGRANAPVTASVAREQVLSGRPFTFALAASGTVASEPNSASASITYTWSKTVTVQRVNEDGSPYAG